MFSGLKIRNCCCVCIVFHYKPDEQSSSAQMRRCIHYKSTGRMVIKSFAIVVQTIKFHQASSSSFLLLLLHVAWTALAVACHHLFTVVLDEST